MAFTCEYMVPIQEAQKLERELTQSKEANAGLMRACDHLERELAEVTKQRDALAEALQWYEKKVSDCRKVTPEGHFARYKLDEDGGKIAAKALAATKGGSHE
jgi:predicted  nucleic acid-binding Zn-ribbon protein